MHSCVQRKWPFMWDFSEPSDFKRLLLYWVIKLARQLFSTFSYHLVLPQHLMMENCSKETGIMHDEFCRHCTHLIPLILVEAYLGKVCRLWYLKSSYIVRYMKQIVRLEYGNRRSKSYNREPWKWEQDQKITLRTQYFFLINFWDICKSPELCWFLIS